MKANKLIITKNERTVDSNNLFTYKFQWCNDAEVMFTELRKIESDEMMLPKETYSIDELKEHKIKSGWTITDLAVETITV